MKYLLKVRKLGAQLKSFVMKRILREQNIREDQLARLRSAFEEELEALGEPVQVLVEPVITDEKVEVLQIEIGPA